MAAVKYKNKREYLDFYAEAAAEKLRQYENREEWQFDGLVPVPVHPARKRKRGFNQAEVLAKRMGERLEMPVYPGASVCGDRKSLLFCRLYWTRTLKWDMIEKIGRGKPYKWKYSGISGRKE